MAALDDGQPTTKGNETRAQHQPFAHGRGVLLQHLAPTRSRQAETGRGVGLVHGDLDRVQRRARHAQEGREHAAGIDHGDIDRQAHRLGRLPRMSDGGMRRRPGDGGLRHAVRNGVHRRPRIRCRPR